MKSKKTITPVMLWITYADGSFTARYFNKQKPLDAWWKTALILKQMGVVKLCSIFRVAAIPPNHTFTTV
ncbi:hypothetical protein [Caballeronia sp. GAWG1-1]|uniref:hypothetical protein n=1 Tax=Caballeronia sp. GAWG1-1 TaxID=2921742 RepID=UPI00202932A5|nr:hypothetical protein [Caballeronia sp. GAWG1-1]